MDDAGDLDRPAGGTSDVDRLRDALVRVDPGEAHDVTVGVGTSPERESVEVDAVVDRRRVGEVRVAVGVADGDVMGTVVIGTVGGQDARAGEAVDGGDQGRADDAAPGERQEVEMVVDEVVLLGLLEGTGDVKRLVDLDVIAVILLVAVGDDRTQLGARGRVAGGVQGDLHAEADEGIGQGGDNLFPGAIATRRGGPRNRRQHGDPGHGRPTLPLWPAFMSTPEAASVHRPTKQPPLPPRVARFHG